MSKSIPDDISNLNLTMILHVREANQGQFLPQGRLSFFVLL